MNSTLGVIKNETLVFVKFGKFCKSGVFWNPQDLLLMMGTEIFKIDASWAEKLTKTRVSFLMTPTVASLTREQTVLCSLEVNEER